MSRMRSTVFTTYTTFEPSMYKSHRHMLLHFASNQDISNILIHMAKIASKKIKEQFVGCNTWEHDSI